MILSVLPISADLKTRFHRLTNHFYAAVCSDDDRCLILPTYWYLALGKHRCSLWLAPMDMLSTPKKNGGKNTYRHLSSARIAACSVRECLLSAIAYSQ